MNNQYQCNLRQIKKGILDRENEEKLHIMDKCNEQCGKRLQDLEDFYVGEKAKLRMAKEAEVRELEDRRKAETEQFLIRNK